MSKKCSCEGSCPVCRLGEVSDHKCNHCKTEFCPKCHGIMNGKVKLESIRTCRCKRKKQPSDIFLELAAKGKPVTNRQFLKKTRAYLNCKYSKIKKVNKTATT